MLRQRGLEREQRILDRLATDGRTVETIIPPDTPFSHRDPVAVAARTRDAMRRGADVIYQGRLEDAGGRWGGYPDLLPRGGPLESAPGHAVSCPIIAAARRARRVIDFDRNQRSTIWAGHYLTESVDRTIHSAAIHCVQEETTPNE